MYRHTGRPLDTAGKLPDHGLLDEVIDPDITLRQHVEERLVGVELHLLNLTFRFVEGFLTGVFGNVVNEDRAGLTVAHSYRNVVTVVVPGDVT